MKVKINNWKSVYNKNEFNEVDNIWVSPDEKYMIIEWYKSELYVFATIKNKTENGYEGDFIETYFPHYMTIDLRMHSADWSCMNYGFCKLTLFELESGFNGTEKRFFFDRKLYAKMYELETGRPYKKKDK